MKNLHRSAEIQVLLSAVFSYYFSMFLTSVLYNSPDWKKLWTKMVNIILVISKQIVDILRFVFFLSFIINIIFSTSSCKSTEVAFGEKTSINNFPARCYSRFESNVTSCLQLPIPPGQRKQSTICPISSINPAAFPVCCGSAWVPLALHLTPVDHAKAQTSIRRSVGQPKTWIPYFISAHSNLQHFLFPPPLPFSSSNAGVWTAKGTGIYYRQNKNWVAKGRLTATACRVLLSGTL